MKYRKLTLFIALALVVFAILLFLKSSSSATAVIWNLSAGGTKLFPLVSLAALIDSINPCAFSILLLTIAFLFSLGTFSRVRILQIGATYLFGIFAAYLAIGLGILQALHLFNTPHFMGRLGALLLIGLGVINLINYFFPAFPLKLQIPRAAHSKIAELMHKTSIPAVFLLGILVGLCEFPCTGGPYLMVLGLLHDAQTKLRGIGYLLWYNLLFVSPLVVVLLLAGQRTVLEKLQAWKQDNLNAVRLWGGVITVLLGLFIFYM
ncbi:MAG: cytochrome c biogenesis protein CcdA [Candidatus Veblenbacteria bacterium]|nr:cytochrome c biogenesis protein CcdA [Candidatus Veblenbacteria bacterium]MDZ4230167.1 cytochrome c biogenesis protein CcdA [Candidatus Veblenbacteria bacterium]